VARLGRALRSSQRHPFQTIMARSWPVRVGHPPLLVVATVDASPPQYRVSLIQNVLTTPSTVIYSSVFVSNI